MIRPVKETVDLWKDKYPNPQPNYGKRPFICPKCKIDLANNNMFCCMNLDCPCQMKVVC